MVERPSSSVDTGIAEIRAGAERGLAGCQAATAATGALEGVGAGRRHLKVGLEARRVGANATRDDTWGGAQRGASIVGEGRNREASTT